MRESDGFEGVVDGTEEGAVVLDWVVALVEGRGSLVGVWAPDFDAAFLFGAMVFVDKRSS